MNSRIVTFVLLFLAGCFVGLQQACQLSPSTSQSSPEVESKLKAFDQFFVQRAFPEEQMDMKAYFQALAQIQVDKQGRSVPTGFDSDWTLQGPGNLGGRVNTIAIHPFDKQIIYAGFATGGVFKTINGGQDWTPIFDDQLTLSIGHITIDPTFPDVIYVGTGDPNISAFPFVGNGLYRSPDGGATWQHLGLSGQRIISKVLVSPQNFNTLYVASMGLPFERNDSRGVYRSTDAGQNWEKILHISDSTGIIDLVMNPNNPQVLYASSWDRVRNNNESIAYGYGAGIYKTEDGGDHWNQLQSGLPSGKFSRVNLALSKVNPSNIYAIYVDTTFEVYGIYKSTNAGGNWTQITQGGPNSQLATALGQQGWYNSRIVTHPRRENELYLLGVNLWRTTSGGATWIPVVPPPGSLEPHVDNHALEFTIDEDIVLGTDGGLYFQAVNSSLWQDIDFIPATQFYRTGYNPFDTATYYGGAQDNGISAGNGDAPNNWEILEEGDGFRTLFHPVFPQKYFIVMPFGRLLVTTNSGQDYTLATFGVSNSDNKNWDSPVLISHHFGDRMYLATDRVYTAISPSIFNQWTAISPQLTDPASPQPRPSISALAESPVRDSLLYAGTTDGLLWRTNDAGGNWVQIDQGLPQRYVTSVMTSSEQEDWVYATFSGYRDNDNTPLIYRSEDQGASWQSISGDLPQLGINDLLVLPNNFDRVFFVATDAGVYASLNNGQNWNRLGGNMPIVPVFDLELNLKKKEVVAASFGRSIFSFSLDSIGLSLDAPPLISFGGAVKTAMGEGINDVRLNYDIDNFSQTTETDSLGNFVMEDLFSGQDCSLKASKNDQHGNGLTTFDLVLIQKHILDITPLDNPLMILAGDANRSNSLTTFDLVLIRKIILQVDTAFQQSESWRFLPTDFIFNHPDDPFLDSIPDTFDCSAINDGNQNVFFTGIKIGDVNFSANPTLLQSISEERSIKDTLFFELEDRILEKEQEVDIVLKAKDFLGILGCQATFDFDPAQIEIQALDGGRLDVRAAEHFGNSNRSKGGLTFSWNDIKARSFKDQEILLRLRVKARQRLRLSEVLRISSRYTAAEAYAEDGTLLLPSLQFKAIPEQATKPLATVFPNPFQEQAQIVLNLPYATTVSLQVYDALGRLCHQQTQRLQKEAQTLVLNAQQFQGAGTYFYQLKYDGKQQTGKLLLLE